MPIRQAAVIFFISAAMVAGAPGATARTGTALPPPRPLGLRYTARSFSAPPTIARCLAQEGQACYTPAELQTAYEVTPLLRAHVDGKGTTIAIVDSFGSPTIAADLRTFDHAFGLSAPPSFRIIAPSGPIPKFNPNGHDRLGWATETSLDVECAHAMAPGANILLVETPVDETIGVTGFPQMIKAENHVIKHKLAQIISQSFGAAEQTFPNAAAIKGLRSAFINARSHHVTIVSATGDQGPTGFSTASENRFFTQRVATWPASDPLVTAVGGTDVHLNQSGVRTRPDSAWNDCPHGGCVSAGGGGDSMVFRRPRFQQRVRSVAGKMRSIPDISMSGDPIAGALVYTSFAGTSRGWHIVGGTSESSPLLAGIVALADQANHTPLGFLNAKLYALGSGSAGIPDVIGGSTSVTFRQDDAKWMVPGFAAVKGYDMATGLGTVNATALVDALTGSSFGKRAKE